jgi:hypothetical protein
VDEFTVIFLLAGAQKLKGTIGGAGSTNIEYRMNIVKVYKGSPSSISLILCIVVVRAYSEDYGVLAILNIAITIGRIVNVTSKGGPITHFHFDISTPCFSSSSTGTK